ncbi:hypothetical protein BGZ96_005171 [Linnemannia gamsii]|uniref:Uncharacterized protein n=1 Tax=Linnemannia gamsii TaxID=64522 RepID=A0ABQ7K4K0_9FUNG|nr:hypothetical protein BGZ96_005171 [Linnemannia gamsii]
MGNFNTLYTFLSTRVLPQNNNTTTEDVKEYTQTATKSRHQRTFSDPSSAMLPKETVQKLFPCDNRHSFNPHYQHNLHTTSTSTIYSTPPSLASSPTDSSPSSTTSSSHSHHTTSPSYTMTQATQKPFYQQPHPRRSQSSSSTRQRQQQQQQQHQQQQQSHHQRLYNNRQQARRLSQRSHANQDDIDNMDDDLLVGYDNQQIYYGSGSSTSMARVHPSGSPSYDTHPSFPSSSDRQHQQHNGRSGYISALSYPPRLSENERTMSPASRSLFAAAASAVKSSIQYGQVSQSKSQYPQHQQQQQQPQQQQRQGRQQRRVGHVRHQSASHFLPSISERRATMHMHEEEDVYTFDHASEGAAASAATGAAGEIRTVSASNSSSSLSSSPSLSSSSTPMTAKQSLLRIAQCDPRQDNWCSQQSGQYTRLYAQTRSNGPLADGRRTRRL